MHKVPIMVPTASTTSSGTLSRIYLQYGVNTIVMGPVDSGKSILANYVLKSLPEYFASCSMCCTSFTTSKEVQTSMERHLERRNKVCKSCPARYEMLFNKHAMLLESFWRLVETKSALYTVFHSVYAEVACSKCSIWQFLEYMLVYITLVPLALCREYGALHLANAN